MFKLLLRCEVQACLEKSNTKKAGKQQLRYNVLRSDTRSQTSSVAGWFKHKVVPALSVSKTPPSIHTLPFKLSAAGHLEIWRHFSLSKLG
ncbi:hypothetical protein QQF64_030285 [Cirrhinus molitorella]|uniref:Uncharacterized protein n=1 Tax=Cirrhinus molitorella TaxID=172907 RepID=A0ABR3N2Z7_9TELE